jgi:hypothetical protein
VDMEPIIPVIGVAGAVAGVYLLTSRVAEDATTVFKEYFAGFRPEPWPHGVQEEDGVRPWGRYVPSGALVLAAEGELGPAPAADMAGRARAAATGEIIYDGPELPLDQSDPGLRGLMRPQALPVHGSVHTRG